MTKRVARLSSMSKEITFRLDRYIEANNAMYSDSLDDEAFNQLVHHLLARHRHEIDWPVYLSARNFTPQPPDWTKNFDLLDE